jgi:hypothetical protein
VSGRSGRAADLEYQSQAVPRVAQRDRPAVADEHRRHPHAVDVDPALAAVDGHPLLAVVVQDQVSR